jgi:UDP-3-O-[3-hydroxymyristoyl] N-acetylglucosamine deacetylase
MQKTYQTTIAKKVCFKGNGLHTGRISNLTILPGIVDQGIIFKRTDKHENNQIIANYKNVTSAKLCTTLENQYGAKVSTVEHLLASLYILGIDNVTVEIDNEEVPIMDGSAKDFLDILKKVEIKILTAKKKYLKVLKKVELIDGSRKISIEPAETFQVDFQLNYANKIIGNQRNLIDFENDKLDEMSSSRTFCLYEDINKIKKAGLAKGGSLDNAIVVDQNKVLNAGGLRNKKEFVNHKILDLAGDLILSGHRILGKIICYQGGHELTNMFLRKLINHNSATYSTNFEYPSMNKSPQTSERFVKLAASA